MQLEMFWGRQCAWLSCKAGVGPGEAVLVRACSDVQVPVAVFTTTFLAAAVLLKILLAVAVFSKTF